MSIVTYGYSRDLSGSTIQVVSGPNVTVSADTITVTVSDDTVTVVVDPDALTVQET